MKKIDRSGETTCSTNESTDNNADSADLQSAERKKNAEESGKTAYYPEDETDRMVRIIGDWFFSKAKDTSLKEAAEIFLGICVFTVGVVAAFIYDGQLKEMRHTNELTQKALDGSTETLNKTLEKLQLQINEAHVLAEHAGEQASQSVIMATNSGKQAIATQSAADTAKNALHISQRAYLSEFTPTIDFSQKFLIYEIANSGKIPSGYVDVVMHQVTYTYAAKYVPGTNPIRIERLWSHKNVDHIALGINAYAKIAVQDATSEKLVNGTQRIVSLISFTYNDGFPGTPIQSVKNCFATRTDNGGWGICDYDAAVSLMESQEGYPKNEDVVQHY